MMNRLAKKIVDDFDKIISDNFVVTDSNEYLGTLELDGDCTDKFNNLLGQHKGNIYYDVIYDETWDRTTICLTNEFMNLIMEAQE